MAHPALPVPRPFACGTGPIGELIDGFDWRATSLGPISGWPNVVRNTVDLILRSPLPMATLWGADGILIYNEGYARIAAGRHPQLLGAPVRAGWPDQAAFNDEVMRVCMAGGTLSYRDAELVLDRGGAPDQVWMNLDYSPIVAEDGSVAGVLALVVDTTDRVRARRCLAGRQDRLSAMSGVVGQGNDVTERVRAERALRASEARFRSFAQAMPAQVWAADAHGQLNWFNDRILAYTGLTQEELAGDGWGRVVHPGDLQMVRSRWTEAVATGAVFEAEVRLRRADGSYRWHLNRALPLREGGAEADMLDGWVGTNTDIEEQKNTAQRYAVLNTDLQGQVALRTAERDRMWRLSRDILLVCGFDGRVQAVSPAFGTLLGWQETDILGKNFMELVHPEDRGATVTQMAALGRGAHVHKFENRYRRKDGSWCLLSWNAAGDEGQVHAIGRDITAEREQLEAIRRTELALQQSQKMETIGKFTGSVAHNFNALLQVISGNLQLLESSRLAVDGPGDAACWIAGARSAVDKGIKLASCLLAFGRRQPLEPRVVRIDGLVSGMHDMLRRALGAEVEINMVIPDGLWNTAVDVARLENVLLNLAINAREAMAGNGGGQRRLGIEAANAVLGELDCRAHGDAIPGQYLMLAVSDTGCGMPPEVAARAFEPFFSTKEEGKGAGLGLSMVYGFAKQSGGHVRIHSEPGHGTTVRLYLPRSTAAGEPAAAAP